MRLLYHIGESFDDSIERGGQHYLLRRDADVDFKNSYEDYAYAAAYAQLEFPGTHYLAFRDLPAILAGYPRGSKALDVGCGTGRSTRFLSELGFEAVGVDIAEEMICGARAIDSHGDYRRVADGDLSQFANGVFSVVLSAFTFDNIPTAGRKVRLLMDVGRVLAPDGGFVNLVSSPEIYIHEWVSFSTKDFSENRLAKSGDQVRIIVTELEDKRPVIDVVFSDEDYRKLYEKSGLVVDKVHRPLGKADEPFEWITETTVAPWVIYVLKPGL